MKVADATGIRWSIHDRSGGHWFGHGAGAVGDGQSGGLEIEMLASGASKFDALQLCYCLPQ